MVLRLHTFISTPLCFQIRCEKMIKDYDRRAEDRSSLAGKYLLIVDAWLVMGRFSYVVWRYGKKRCKDLEWIWKSFSGTCHFHHFHLERFILRCVARTLQLRHVSISKNSWINAENLKIHFRSKFANFLLRYWFL